MLQRAATGDATAFPACVDRFGPLVWTLARQLIADRTEAEDAVQEVFVELWRCADRYDPSVASARAFVATIARRRLIDRGRVRQRQMRGMQSLEGTDDARIRATTHKSTVDDDARDALRELDRLRPEQRDVIRLAVQAGWNHEQIAAHLSMPLGTVKTHLRRGILRIREVLGATAGGPGEGEGTS